jgi:predicted AlkP superfamily pyrophosphatase or phosphodiesterase
MRRRRVTRFGLGLLAVLLGLGLAVSPARAESPAARHVLMISVDGLGASWLTAPPPNLRIPNIRRLQAEGSYAEGVVGVYPSLTYPSHTTLVTGRVPAEHGIYSNLSSRQAGKNPDDWFWFASAIKVPTVWDEARRHGLTSAAISWPVTVGAAIDWNVPEVWDPKAGETADYQYVAKFATPGLIPEAMAALGPPEPGADDDTVRTRMAAYLLKQHGPNLMLVHLAALDEAEHDHGPASAEAVATLERLDIRVGELLAAVKNAGLENSTDVFIVSDHGFLPVEREIQPNVLLERAGLLQADEKGRTTGGRIATAANGGTFFIYWPESQNLRAEVDTALRPLRDAGVLWSVFYREALVDLGAEPAVQMVLEAPSGASFGDDAKGEVVRKRARPGGTHGYLPFRKELEASFIAWGPSIKKGVNLHRIPMTAVGPTILKALGIENPRFGAQPPLVDIFK